MGAHPEVAMLRRFAALSTQNILYLQAELNKLESDLRAIEKEDLESGDIDRSIYGRDWQTLSESVQFPGQGRQWVLFLEIRKKLNEYSTSSSPRKLILGTEALQMLLCYSKVVWPGWKIPLRATSAFW